MRFVSREPFHDHHRNVFYLVEPEPTRGLEPRTYRLQDFPSALITVASSDCTVYSDRSGGQSGMVGREFVSQVVSRLVVSHRALILLRLGQASTHGRNHA
jgi:hypothetical protein